MNYEEYEKNYLLRRNDDYAYTTDRRVFKYIDYCKRFGGCFWEDRHHGWRYYGRPDKYKSRRKGRC